MFARMTCVFKKIDALRLGGKLVTSLRGDPTWCDVSTNYDLNLTLFY